MGVNALIGLGGNLGDVRACFVQARAALAGLPGSSLSASSLLYGSPPMGPVEQPDYLNAVIRLATSLRPEQLLEHMQVIEARHGRKRGEHWGPRTLDLDLIAHGDAVSDTPELALPHPHMHERIFVLQPLCDVDLDWRHPTMGKTATQLLEVLFDQGNTRLSEGQTW